MAGPDLLERIDAILTAVLELRAAVVGAEAADECSSTTTPADDLADALIDTTSAGARTGFARDTTAM